ncbi:MAG TPA: alpha/beta fold hydrolase [Chloroflexi bacterium]|nr:alpha/beta fold hydrolase [Chloroflexota bacterium]
MKKNLIGHSPFTIHHLPFTIHHLPFTILLLLLFIFSAPVAADSPPVKAGVFEEVPCSISTLKLEERSGGVTCGTLTVPEKHSAPNGPAIQLGVVIIHSFSDALAPDPLIMLQGGPGGSTIDTYALPMLGQTNIRVQRDIILFDQRGTMHSEPFLACPESLAYTQETLDKDLSLEEDIAGSVDAELACRDRLRSENIDLSAYNSLENAADIEALRLALGFEQINLYGVSYGALLAQHFMRRFPDSARSVILDAVVPTQTNFITQIPYTMDRAYKALFSACADDPQCNTNYPDLEQVFFELAAKLDQDPLRVPLTDPETNRRYQWHFDGNDLTETVFQLLYSSEILPALPMLIYDLKDGRSDFLSTILPLLIFDRTMSNGMYDSVMCAEDSDFSLADMAVGGARTEFVDSNLIQADAFKSLCQQWGVPDLGAEIDAPVTGKVPTLLLSGHFDPITPPEFGEMVAKNLSRSYAYTFPNTGHGAFLSSHCAENIVLDFLDNPATSPDATCIEQESGVTFLLSKDIVSTPAMGKVLGLFSGRYLGAAAILSLALLILLSAFIVWPLAWLIRALMDRPPTNPPRWGWAAWLLVWTLGALSSLFLLGIVALIIVEGFINENEIQLLLGVPRVWGPLFALPLLVAGLSAGVVIFALLSWKGRYWSIWKRLYYSLLALAAISLVIVFFNWGVIAS